MWQPGLYRQTIGDWLLHEREMGIRSMSSIVLTDTFALTGYFMGIRKTRTRHYELPVRRGDNGFGRGTDFSCLSSSPGSYRRQGRLEGCLDDKGCWRYTKRLHEARKHHEVHGGSEIPEFLYLFLVIRVHVEDTIESTD